MADPMRRSMWGQLVRDVWSWRVAVGLFALVFLAGMVYVTIDGWGTASSRARAWEMERDSALVARDEARALAAATRRQLQAANTRAAAGRQMLDSLAKHSRALETSIQASRVDADRALTEARAVTLNERSASSAWYERATLSLRQALDSADARHVTDTLTAAELRAQVALLRSAAEPAVGALVGLERSNDQLASVVASAEAGCRLVWRVKCPTRRVVAIGALVTGGLVGLSLGGR